MAKSREELETRIAVLERKVEREKKARVMSEQHLEHHSRAVYEANQSLQASLAMARKSKLSLNFCAKHQVMYRPTFLCKS
ncbi:hypothetical protein P4S73_25880 [Paraglaciecola sp. Hal342]